jgi:hypothetical protein
MNGCDRVIEVEDLVLGLASSDELEAHVETCVDCKDAREMFLAERALFVARPVPEAPPLAMPKPAIARVYRFVPAMAAVAACVAIFVGRPHRDDCDEPAPAPVVDVKTDEVSTANGICRAPEMVSVALASHDESACVPSPNATCEVTSSTAMP